MGLLRRFFGAEERSEDTSALTEAILLGAGSQTGLERLGVVESVAAFWAKTLSVATVTPDSAARVLTPAILAMTGRELFLHGEAVFSFEVVCGKLAAVPSANRSTVVGGTIDRNDWMYQVTHLTPSASPSKWMQGSDVLHFQYATRANQPYRGISPLTTAGLDASALSGLMGRIDEQSRAQAGTLHVFRGQSLSRAQYDQLQFDVKGLGGRTLFKFIPASGRSGGGGVNTAKIGFQPDTEVRSWAKDLERRVMNAGGLSPALLVSESDGTASREALRRFAAITANHLGQVVSEEASLKLEQDVVLTFEKLRGSDSQGLGRALKAMTDAGMSLADALQAVGLD